MKTKRILIISSDKNLIEVVKISAITLTKLNCQVSIETSFDCEEALEKSKPANLDLIIIDNESKKINSVKLISEIRKDIDSEKKKIILIYSGSINRDEVFKAGCDSIMTEEEFKKVVNNILVF